MDEVEHTMVRLILKIVTLEIVFAISASLLQLTFLELAAPPLSGWTVGPEGHPLGPSDLGRAC